jgi:hypothetical protein
MRLLKIYRLLKHHRGMHIWIEDGLRYPLFARTGLELQRMALDRLPGCARDLDDDGNSLTQTASSSLAPRRPSGESNPWDAIYRGLTIDAGSICRNATQISSHRIAMSASGISRSSLGIAPL